MSTATLVNSALCHVAAEITDRSVQLVVTIYPGQADSATTTLPVSDGDLDGFIRTLHEAGRGTGPVFSAEKYCPMCQRRNMPGAVVCFCGYEFVKTAPASYGDTAAGEFRFCSACNVLNDPGAVTCIYCHRPITAMEPPSPPGHVPGTGGFLFCDRCNTMNEPWTVTCIGCGGPIAYHPINAVSSQPLVQLRGTKTCPACGLLSNHTDIRCRCGHSF